MTAPLRPPGVPRGGPNLAHRPFENLRPVRRAAAGLWVLGALLCAGNAALLWRYFSGVADQRERLAGLEATIEEKQRAIEQAEKDLGRLDLEWQNAQVEFLNERIGERTFPWSDLFDELAAVLPPKVRLYRLQPQARERRLGAAARRAETGSRRVALRLDGAAQGGEALLEFVDALFAHPRFDDPNPESEATKPGSPEVVFSLTVAFLPGVAPAAPAPAAGPGAGTLAAAAGDPEAAAPPAAAVHGGEGRP